MWGREGKGKKYISQNHSIHIPCAVLWNFPQKYDLLVKPDGFFLFFSESMFYPYFPVQSKPSTKGKVL